MPAKRRAPAARKRKGRQLTYADLMKAEAPHGRWSDGTPKKWGGAASIENATGTYFDDASATKDIAEGVAPGTNAAKDKAKRGTVLGWIVDAFTESKPKPKPKPKPKAKRKPVRLTAWAKGKVAENRAKIDASLEEDKAWIKKRMEEKAKWHEDKGTKPKW